MKSVLLKNGLYNALGSIIRIVLGIITIPALIRIIGIKEYGLWTLVSSIASVIILSEGGLATATTVFIAQDLSKDDEDGLSSTLTAIIIFVFFISTAALVGTEIASKYLPFLFKELTSDEYLIVSQALQASGIVVWARIIQQVMVGIEQAHQKYAQINFLSSVQSILMTMGLLVVASLGGKSVVMMQYQAVISFFLLLIHLCVCWKLLFSHYRIRFYFDRIRASSIIVYSLSAWVTNLGGTIFSKFDKLVVGSVLGSSSLGVYAAITGITAQINSFSALLLQPLFPALASKFASGEDVKKTIWPSVKKALKVNCIISLGMGCILISYSSIIIEFMIPSSAYNSSKLLIISIVIYSLYSINAIGYVVCLSMHILRKSMQVILGSGILSLILITILCHVYGLLGAVIGNIGYLMTIALVFIAGSYLNVSRLEIAKIMFIPILLFLLFAVTNLFIEDFFLKNIFLITTLFGLISHFCYSQSIFPSQVLKFFR